MKQIRLILLMVALVIAANIGYAQDTVKLKIPTIYVGGKVESGKQTKEAILEKPFLEAKAPDSETKWTIESYRVVFVADEKEEAPISVIGARFSEEVIAKIESAKSGTMIEIYDIKISSTEGTQHIVRPFVIRIQ